MQRSNAPTVSLVAYIRRALALVAGVLLATVVNAANVTVTWSFNPMPETVNINTNETVTWMGTFATHPLRQATDNTFTVAGSTLITNAGNTVTRTFSTPGTYYFMCEIHPSFMRTTVVVTAACPLPPYATLDIDGNGQVDALTDGVLTLRYLLGLRGPALVAGATGNCASRDTAAIEAYLAARAVP